MRSKQQEPQDSLGVFIKKRERLDPIQTLPPASEGKMQALLKAINPFGPIVDAYTKTLAYKLEVKRLKLDLEQIQIQADLAHHAIESTLQLKMKELEIRQRALAASYQMISNEIQQLHIEREKVLQIASDAAEMALRSDLSLEERKMCANLTCEMTRNLATFGDQSIKLLQEVVQLLPPAELPRQLFGGE